MTIQNRKVLIALFCVAIAVINFLVFYPSFSHVARADHLAYLIETENIDNIFDLLNYSYSYDRHRLIQSGDYFLFRPLYYLYLSVMRWLFGLNFTYWQIAGFLLHLFIVWQLLRLLMLVRSSFLSLVFVLHFSVLHISQEMVIWHHISAYMIFLIFLLEALYHFVLYIQKNQEELWRLVSMAGYLTLACFTHEFGVICTLFFFLLLSINKKKTNAYYPVCRERSVFARHGTWMLLIPIAIYAYVSYVDYVLHAPTALTSTMGGDVNVIMVLTNFLSLLMMSACFGFLPYCITIIPGQRLMLIPYNWNDIVSNYSAHPLGYTLNALTVLLILLLPVLIVASKCTDRKTAKKDINTGHDKQAAKGTRMLGFMAGLMFISYIAFMALRSSAHSMQSYIMMSLYHFYIVELFLTIAFYCIYSAYTPRSIAYKKCFNGLLVAILCISACLNAAKTYQVNCAVRDLYRPWGVYIKRLKQFIEEHRNERDFSYTFVGRSQARHVTFTVTPANKEQLVMQGFLSDFLFRKHFRRRNAKYYLVYFDEEGIIVFSNEGEARRFLVSPLGEARQQEGILLQ